MSPRRYIATNRTAWCDGTAQRPGSCSRPRFEVPASRRRIRIEQMASDPKNKRVLIVGIVVFLLALPVLGFGLGTSGSADRLKGSAAVDAALRDARVKNAAQAEHYDRTLVLPLDSNTARVSFFAGQRVVVEAGVDPRGRVIAFQVIPPGYVRAGA